LKILFLLAPLLFSCRGQAPHQLKVIGGEEISDHEFPAVIAIMQPSGLPCTGTVVGKGTILTAAHCTLNTPLTALGRPVELLIRGDDSGQAGEHDLAVLRLQEDAALDPEPIPLAVTGSNLGSTVVIVGFGHGDPDEHDKIGVKRIGRNHLSSVSELLLIGTPSGDVSGLDRASTASGDSGGPLIVDGRLLGVATGRNVSWNGARQSWFVDILSDPSRNLLQRAEKMGANIERSSQ
jgi:hypothetical protein